jgi:hypothetical protein
MCEDNDMDGARLWFYGGTPPLDEPLLTDQDVPTLPKTGWGWLKDRSSASIDRPPELAAA